MSKFPHQYCQLMPWAIGYAPSEKKNDEASQENPSEEGLPTGFAHGARPPGLAHRAHSQGSPSAETVARRGRRRHAREWTESDDSPAVLVEASQELPSAEGMPIGFAHGACPPGLAHRAHPQGSPSRG